MIEWLAAWGATEFIFKPILEALAQDAAKDWAKDIFKNSLSSVLKQPSREYQKAAGKAIREFLVLMEQGFEYAELSEEEIRKFTRPLKKFVKDKAAMEILGAPFKPDFKKFEVCELAERWEALELPLLPDDFSWEPVIRLYPKRIRKIAEELKIPGPVDSSDDFNLEKYREGTIERYSRLNMESLDTTGAYYDGLRLWNMFIPQNVRETREYIPQAYELPKEVQKRLKKQGQMPEDFQMEELERFRQFYQEQAVQPVIEAAADSRNPYMVILGDPGSGKSTFLRLAQRLSDPNGNNLFPVFIKAEDLIGLYNHIEITDIISAVVYSTEKEILKKKGKNPENALEESCTGRFWNWLTTTEVKLGQGEIGLRDEDPAYPVYPVGNSGILGWVHASPQPTGWSV